MIVQISGLSEFANQDAKATSSATVLGLSSPMSTFSLPFNVSQEKTNVELATFQRVRI